MNKVISASDSSHYTVIKYQINSGWQFKVSGENKTYPATVPGCVHTDLMNNNLIDDPFFGLNENSLQWIGYKDWIYEVQFDLNDEILSKKNIQLIFQGLDTYASVYLNDSMILNADNMFREWKMDCRQLLKKSDNTLKIKFTNVFDVNLPKWKEAPFRLSAFSNNDQADTMIVMYSRKAQFHYGWDWGPRLITCGVWRPVFICAWDDFKLDDVQIIQQNVNEREARLISKLEVSSDKEQKVSISIQTDTLNYIFDNINLNAGVNKIELPFTVGNPKLWWTNGLGEQNIYDFTFLITNNEGISDKKNIKTGLRSLEVVREKDEFGKSMYVKLNGIPVFMKGANYIPQDNFQNRVTEEKYDYIIKSAADANMNMLRIWGGGIYEENLFYELCDKYGILVWQDLMFACAMYPADEQFLENIKQELVDNIKRIRNYACIALYCGNNENEISWYQWGWKEKYSPDIQKKYENDLHKLFRETIPKVLNEVDPLRYYHPTSPIASYNNISANEGDIHYWGVWHGKEPFAKYADNIARFVSEYGFQSYPEISTIEKYTNAEDRDLHTPVMLSHQRCMADDRKDKEYGNRLIKNYMDQHYREPKDFESYIYVSQLLQAEGVKFGIESHRRNMPKCMGSLYWQLDDCWPVTSWSSIDYYGRWKALHYFAKNAYEKIHIIPIRNDGVEFHVVSDSRNSFAAELEVKVINFNGDNIYQNSFSINVLAGLSKKYVTLTEEELLNSWDKNKTVLICKLKADNKIISENTLYFAEPSELELEKPEIKLDPVNVEDGYNITLTTNKIAKNVYLHLDDSSFFSDNYFDLIPGEPKIIHLKTKVVDSTLIKKIKIKSLVDTY